MSKKGQQSLLCAILTLLGAILAMPANSSSISIDHGDNPKFITIEGELLLGDELKFSRIAASLTGVIVQFNSSGGNLYAGVEIGKLIHSQMDSTFVPSGSHCYSACAIAWLGGNVRGIGTKGVVGFHGAFTESDAGKSTTGPGNAIVGSFLGRLGLSDEAIFKLTEPDPDHLLFLEGDIGKNLGIDYVIFDDLQGIRFGMTPSSPTAPAPQVSVNPMLPATASTDRKNELFNACSDFINRYFVLWNSPNSSQLTEIRSYYAETVNFYDKTYKGDFVFDQKIYFIERWPIRKYLLDASSINIEVSRIENTCDYSGILSYHTENPSTKKIANGRAYFKYTIDFSHDNPKIIAETGKVLARY